MIRLIRGKRLLQARLDRRENKVAKGDVLVVRFNMAKPSREACPEKLTGCKHLNVLSFSSLSEYLVFKVTLCSQIGLIAKETDNF